MSLSKNIKITEMKEHVWNNYISTLTSNSNTRIDAQKSIMFSDLYNKVAHSTNMQSKNTKIQTFFLTLLHLANERNLVIENREDDIRISPFEGINNIN